MTLLKRLTLMVGFFLFLMSAQGCDKNAGDSGAVILAVFTSQQAYSMDAGQTIPVSVSITNDPTGKGVTFTASSGTVGTTTLTSNGGTEKEIVSYAAPSTVVSATTVTLTATSVAAPSQSVSITITVSPALAITTLTLPTPTQGLAYTATLAASGGSGTQSWSVTSGGLPSGLQLNSTTGVISGTPAAAGSYSFTLEVTDSSATPATATHAYTVTVLPPPPVVTTASLPSGVIGTAYSQQLAYTGGTGGTVLWAIVSGSLPSASGLTLSSNGLISGTPAAANVTYTFSVAVTVGTQTSLPVTLAFIAYSPVVITTTTIPPAHAYVAYSQQLQLSGGNGSTPVWSITSGSLPSSSGLSLSSSGSISGTPTAASQYSFSVTATVGSQTSAPQAYTLTVTSITITSPLTVTGEVGLPFLDELSAVGGATPYQWSVTGTGNALPSGLSLSASTGVIIGAPTTASGSPFTNIVIQVKDANGSIATFALTIKVDSARGSANNSELNGQYAFLLNGFDAAGNPLAMEGTVTADGAGHITAGTADTNGTGLSAPATAVSLSASTYGIGPDNRGEISLKNASSTSTFVIVVNSLTSGVAGGGTMAEFDDSGVRLSGTFAAQTPSAFSITALNSGYAFGLAGSAANSTASAMTHSGGIGEIQLNGTAAASSAELLLSSTGSNTPIVPTGSTLTVARNGRGMLSMLLPGTLGQIDLVFYVLSPNALYLLSSDAASGSSARDLLSGTAMAETTSSGSFGLNSLSATAVWRTQDLGGNASAGYFADVRVGLFNFTGAGTFTAGTDENAGGVATANSYYGSYSVASNGRVTAYIKQASLGGCLDCSNVPAIFFYLVGANQGYVMDFSTGVVTGYFEPQTATTITAAAFSGNYSIGTNSPLVSAVLQQSGYLYSTGSGSVTGTVDQNTAALLTPNVAESASYTASSNGRFAFTMSAIGTPVVYVVSANKMVTLDLASSSPAIQEAIHQ